MKKIILISSIFLIVSSCAKRTQVRQTEEMTTEQAPALKGQKIMTQDFFYIYKDGGAKENHYIPSGWMGDYGDMQLNQRYTQNPQSGKSSISISYSAKMSQGAGWCGIFWQWPANNWGDVKGGYNLTDAKRLTFWARGKNGGEIINEFKVGGIRGIYSDSDSVMIGPIELTKNWKKYEIDLSDADLSYISGGFCWATSKDNNPNGFTIYLDEIRFEFK